MYPIIVPVFAAVAAVMSNADIPASPDIVKVLHVDD